MHRKKAKIIFRKEHSFTTPYFDKKIPNIYVEWVEVVKKFYSELTANESLVTRLAKLKITPEDITKGLTSIQELESARKEYLKGKGQDATKIKNEAFALLNDWMTKFYSVARIALEAHPQLLEVLCKHVKS